ncbi:MAG: hypothetical protein WCH31_01160 [Actinomycetes bacterium]
MEEHGTTTPRNILVIANETVEGAVLHDAVIARAGDAEAVRVLVVTPALNSRLRRWTSDEDGARHAAEARLENCLARLHAAGLDTEGRVGDADPLQAIDDGLRVFDADEIVIATHPEGRSNWLERDLIGKARARYEQTVTHVIVESGVHATVAA